MNRVIGTVVMLFSLSTTTVAVAAPPRSHNRLGTVSFTVVPSLAPSPTYPASVRMERAKRNQLSTRLIYREDYQQIIRNIDPRAVSCEATRARPVVESTATTLNVSEIFQKVSFETTTDTVALAWVNRLHVNLDPAAPLAPPRWHRRIRGVLEGHQSLKPVTKQPCGAEGVGLDGIA